MKNFIKNIILFLFPLVLFITPAIVLFAFSGEFFKTPKIINNTINQDESRIGYMIAQKNYRRLKFDHILKNKTYDIWALGSSRVLMFRQKMFSSSIYNLGIMIRSLSDIKALLIEVPKVKMPKVIVLGLDQWMFNDDWARNVNVNSQNFWKTSFQFLPNFKDIIYLYSKALTSDFSPIDIIKNSRNDKNKLGLFALLYNSGLRSDGSYDNGAYKENKDNDYLESRTEMYAIRNGNQKFEYGQAPREQSFNELIDILNYFQKNDINVISFFPPYSNLVYGEMERLGNNYKYINESSKRLKLIFDNFGYEFWDLSDPSIFSSKDDEFMDGLHGTEICYNKALLYMLEQGSVLGKSTDLEKIKDYIKVYN